MLQRVESWMTGMEEATGIQPDSAPRRDNHEGRIRTAPPPLCKFTVTGHNSFLLINIILNPALLGPVLHRVKVSETLPFASSTTVETTPDTSNSIILIPATPGVPLYVQLETRYLTSDWNRPTHSGYGIAATESECCSGTTACGMSLMVKYEMLARSQQSSSSSEIVARGTYIRFDPSWFDGSPVFSVEIIAQNTNASTPYNIIIEQSGGTDIVSVTVPANTPNPVVLTPVEFTPPVGTIVYQMRTPQTASNGQVVVVSVRIRIKQTAATKTRLQVFHWMGGAAYPGDLVYGDSRSTSSDSGYIEESQAPYFLKESNTWANISHWTLESVGGNTGILGTNTSYAALASLGGGIIAVNTHLGDPDLQSSDFSDLAANFVNDGEYTLFTRATATHFSGNNTLFLKASVYVTLNYLSKALVFYRVTGDDRQLIDVADYEVSPDAYFEITATEGSAGTKDSHLVTSTTPDTTSTETAVTGSEIDPVGAPKDRYRVTGFADPAGIKYYGKLESAGTGSISVIGPELLLRISSSGDCGDGVPPRLTDLEEIVQDLADDTITRTIGILIDGGGTAILTGVKGDLYIPFACTITAVTMLADTSGSIVVDIWKDTYANYPPTVADTITAAAKPTISSAVKSQDTTLTGWTTAIAAGSILRFNVDSVSGISRVTLALTVVSSIG
jgi:hypothetical protein